MQKRWPNVRGWRERSSARPITFLSFNHFDMKKVSSKFGKYAPSLASKWQAGKVGPPQFSSGSLPNLDHIAHSDSKCPISFGKG